MEILNRAIKDTKWKARPSGRCATDYTRGLLFEEELSEVDLGELVEYIKKEDYAGRPGSLWCKKSRALDKSGYWYEMFTTYDSSD